MTGIILATTVLQIFAPFLQQALTPSSYAAHAVTGSQAVSVTRTVQNQLPPITPPPVIPTATGVPTGTGPQIVLQDTFARPGQRGWGASANNVLWQGDAQNDAFSIQDGVGQIVGGQGMVNAQFGPQQTDTDVLLSGSTTSFEHGQVNLQVVLREVDENNLYKVVLDGATFAMYKRVHGISTLLVQVPFTALGNTRYAIRFRASGTMLYAKVWKSSNAEPVTWTLAAQDNAFSFGFVGIRVHLQMGIIIRVHEFFAQGTLPA